MRRVDSSRWMALTAMCAAVAIVTLDTTILNVAIPTIRRDLQTALVNEGYRVRVYIPFGREWFPYFMRRLGERPANVAFVLRGILGERG